MGALGTLDARGTSPPMEFGNGHKFLKDLGAHVIQWGFWEDGALALSILRGTRPQLSIPLQMTSRGSGGHIVFKKLGPQVLD